jgi:Cof subfamily protein (haloacid dehalogenase superfamily)
MGGDSTNPENWGADPPNANGVSTRSRARHTAHFVTYRILALDIDGTILDPYGKLPGVVCNAVAAAKRRGLRVILCTGRRFRTSLPIAKQLDLMGPIVVNNGVLVKDIESGETSRHQFLSIDDFQAIIPFVRRVGSPLAYVDTFHEQVDALRERCSETHAFQSEYLSDNRSFFQTVDDLRDQSRSDVIMISTMGDEKTLLKLRDEAGEEFGDRIHTHILINKNYHGVILEFFSPGSGKWPALCAIAEQANVNPREIIAIGDDNNDIEMIRGAGLGIAMGNASPVVQEAADRVTGSNAEGGAAEAIESALMLL